jgi:hypothetical protein
MRTDSRYADGLEATISFYAGHVSVRCVRECQQTEEPKHDIAAHVDRRRSSSGAVRWFPGLVEVTGDAMSLCLLSYTLIVSDRARCIALFAGPPTYATRVGAIAT